MATNIQGNTRDAVKAGNEVDISKRDGAGALVVLTAAYAGWESEEFDCSMHGSVRFAVLIPPGTITEYELVLLAANKPDTESAGAYVAPTFEPVCVVPSPTAGKSQVTKQTLGFLLADFPADGDGKSRSSFAVMVPATHRIKLQMRAVGAIAGTEKPQVFAMGGKGI